MEAAWNEGSEIVTQSEVQSTVNSVALKMKDFLFGLMLAECIVKHTTLVSYSNASS